MMRCISAAGPSPRTCWLREQTSLTRRAARLTVVDGHQIRVAEKKIDVVRRERGFRLLVVDAVQDQVEVAVVALDLWMVHLGDGVFHGQWMEVEDVGKHRQFVGVGPARSTQTLAPLAGSSQAGSTRSTVSVRPSRCTKTETISMTGHERFRQVVVGWWRLAGSNPS